MLFLCHYYRVIKVGNNIVFCFIYIAESSNEDSNSVLLEETIRHIMNKDILKELPINLLAQLNEVCARAIVEKIQQS